MAMTNAQPPAGWYPDPHDGTRQRHWSGEAWTEHVRPAAAPSPVTPDGDWQTSLRVAVTRPRPAPDLLGALSATGGLVVTVGLVLLLVQTVSDSSSDDSVIFGIIGVILGVAAYVAVLAGPQHSRAAALVGAVVGPLLGVVALLSTVSDPRTALGLGGALLAALWFAMFAGPGFRGSPVLLGASLVGAWAAVASLLVEPLATHPGNAPILGGSGAVYTPQPFDSSADFGTISLVCALVYLVAAWALDRAERHVAATPFIAVAAAQAAFGTSAASSQLGGIGDGVLLLLVAALFLVVGATGARRGSLWIGAALGAVGLIAVVAAMTTESFAAGGVLLLVIGLALVWSAPAISHKVAAPTTEVAVPPQPF